MMQPDAERIFRISRGLRESGLDGLVCSLATNVLLLTGYWPVVGTAVAVANCEGKLALVAPEDERELVERGWAHDCRFFESGSLEEIRSTIDTIRQPLLDVLRELGMGRWQVGVEAGPCFEPSTYAAMNFYGASLRDALKEAVPSIALVPADELLARLRSRPTQQEIERIRIACEMAEQAFRSGARLVRPGQREDEVAAGFRQPLSFLGGQPGVARADGYAFCMSGPNSARAYGAYARSRERRVERGDLLLVHCNSYADGYWTDISRTYCLGDPTEPQLRMYQAVLAGREAALAAIRPGAGGSEVDRAARRELTRRGFGAAFKHPCGHGVGFAAIDHHAIPRIHPHSNDRLEPGMVFNVEPAIYLDDVGGLRHCDMIVVTESGAELLTPFHASLPELILHS